MSQCLHLGTSRRGEVEKVKNLIRKHFPSIPNIDDVAERTVMTATELRSGNVVFVAPTGYGKTAVALGSFVLLNDAFDYYVYLVPTKALAWEKYKLFSSMFQTSIVTAEFPALFETLSASKVIVSTYFKFNAIISQVFSRLYRIYREAGKRLRVLVVLDEFHNVLSSPDLAITVSSCLAYKYRLLGLTATLAERDVSLVRKWMRASVISVETPVVEKRIHTHKLVIDSNGTVTFMGVTVPAEEIVTVDARYIFVERLVESIISRDRNAKILIFVPYRRTAEYYASRLADLLSELGFKCSVPHPLASSLKDNELKTCVEHCVYVHHGGLPQYLYYAILDALQKGDYKVVVSCYTLSQGVNFDYTHLVLPSLEGLESATVFNQLVGRVGRFGGTAEIHVIVDEAEEALLREYLLKTPADPVAITYPTKFFMTELLEGLLARFRNVSIVREIIENTPHAHLYGSEVLAKLFEECFEWLLNFFDIRVNEDGSVYVNSNVQYRAMLLSLLPDVYYLFEDPQKLKEVYANHGIDITIHDEAILRMDLREILSVIYDVVERVYGLKVPWKCYDQVVWQGYMTAKAECSQIKEVIAMELEKALMLYKRVGERSKAEKINVILQSYYAGGIDPSITEKLLKCGASFKELRYLASQLKGAGNMTMEKVVQLLYTYYRITGLRRGKNVLKCLTQG